MLLIEKQKIFLNESMQKLSQKEQDCLVALRLITECLNPSTKKIFYPYCIRPNAKCEIYHIEMEKIQQEKLQHFYQTRILDQDEFILFCGATRHGFLDIIDKLVSENSCNYIDRLDGRTVLYDAVRYEQFEIVKKILPFMKIDTIQTKVRYFPAVQHSVLELATGEIKQYIQDYLV